jgi:flagellar export protein FliJ
MKKYAFRLETVRRVRRAQETVAKANLARANNEVTDAIAAVEARITRYEEKLATRPEGAALPTGGTVVRVDAFMRRRYFNELAGNAVVAARSSLSAAQLEADIARGMWSEKAKEVKALDRLDERRKEEHLLAYNHEVTAEVDDIVTGRFSRLKDAQ